jgi:hypothetical protein
MSRFTAAAYVMLRLTLERITQHQQGNGIAQSLIINTDRRISQ